ncbi:fungal protein [Schizosaccharomyces japonicus yFS275]|uniref:Fungal protein n=1 Tax=Schizosaccharomyces japonicus (strain yFS275 / FY16936) TaxID=402676 RepID=B6K473_SCHJY|nr:fungal protein [Schizosaccharomyces japonicus yFS275]EEB08280.1 fungal protein [Schizosaccharomyces japonicus yFS275]
MTLLNLKIVQCQILSSGINNINFYRGSLLIGCRRISNNASRQTPSARPRKGKDGWLSYRENGYKLAETVKHFIAQGKVDKALERINIIKRAPKVVAFNHLLTHYADNKQVRQAWKLFNDMKKWNHSPNDYSYSIMFRALNNFSKTSVAEQQGSHQEILEKLYASLRKGTQENLVNLNTIHLAGMLQFCMHTGNLAFAKQLCEENIELLDADCFTLLYQLCENITAGTKYAREEVLEASKTFWMCMLNSNTKEKPTINEKNLCAFAAFTIAFRKDGLAAISLLNAQLPKDLRIKHPAQLDVDQTVTLSRRIQKPSWRSLSTLLQACNISGLYKEADLYWQLFTTYPGFTKNEHNYHEYLRIAVARKDPRLIKRLLEEMVTNKLKLSGKTFLIALSQCNKPQFRKYAHEFWSFAPEGTAKLKWVSDILK